MTAAFEKNSFKKRLNSMLAVDFRRLFTMPHIYLFAAVSLVMPILILVMTSLMDGMVSVDPQTGAETVMEGFDNVWQIIGTVSGASADPAAAMSITSMCNINMLYFLIAVPVCIFISADFRSGYAKNLFTVRAKKTDYVVSKTLVAFVCGGIMIIFFFIGSLIGGAIAGLPFAMEGFNAFNLVMCMLTKVMLVGVFAPIFVTMAVTGKQKLWLSLILSFMVGMFMFMMIPMVSPLNSTPMNLLLAVAGGGMFCFGLGGVSNLILKRTSLV